MKKKQLINIVVALGFGAALYFGLNYVFEHQTDPAADCTRQGGIPLYTYGIVGKTFQYSYHGCEHR